MGVGNGTRAILSQSAIRVCSSQEERWFGLVSRATVQDTCEEDTCDDMFTPLTKHYKTNVVIIAAARRKRALVQRKTTRAHTVAWLKLRRRRRNDYGELRTHHYNTVALHEKLQNYNKNKYNNSCMMDAY